MYIYRELSQRAGDLICIPLKLSRHSSWYFAIWIDVPNVSPDASLVWFSHLFGSLPRDLLPSIFLCTSVKIFTGLMDYMAERAEDALEAYFRLPPPYTQFVYNVDVSPLFSPCDAKHPFVVHILSVLRLYLKTDKYIFQKSFFKK